MAIWRSCIELMLCMVCILIPVASEAGDASVPRSAVIVEGNASIPQCVDKAPRVPKRSHREAPGVQFRGKVVSWSGAPIAGATVMVYLGDRAADTNIMFNDMASVIGKTDADGTFHVTLQLDPKGLAGSFQRLEVSATGFERAFGPTVAGGDYCVSVMLVGSNH